MLVHLSNRRRDVVLDLDVFRPDPKDGKVRVELEAPNRLSRARARARVVERIGHLARRGRYTGTGGAARKYETAE